jgi:hypothetical protein
MLPRLLVRGGPTSARHCPSFSPCVRGIRQHANPLTSFFFRAPAEAVERDWPTRLFSDPSRPLHIDLGCAGGQYICALAARERALELAARCDASPLPLPLRHRGGSSNFLGLDVRAGVIEAANERIRGVERRSSTTSGDSGRGGSSVDGAPPAPHPTSNSTSTSIGLSGRVACLLANLQLSHHLWLGRYPGVGPAPTPALSGGSPYSALAPGSVLPGLGLRTVTILHPDPCFKARTRKRRVVTPALVRLLAFYMRPSSSPPSSDEEGEGPPPTVYLQTDVPELLDDMCAVFEGAEWDTDRGRGGVDDRGGPSPYFSRVSPDPPLPLIGDTRTQREALVRTQAKLWEGAGPGRRAELEAAAARASGAAPMMGGGGGPVKGARMGRTREQAPPHTNPFVVVAAAYRRSATPFEGEVPVARLPDRAVGEDEG